MSRFQFSLATDIDDAELRQRMAEDHMPGRVSISFRREPSYFRGSRVQGRQVQVIKCVDLDSQRIIGLGCRALSPVWINGQQQTVGYLADLRGQPSYRGSTLLARGYQYLRQLHQQDAVQLYYTMILDDNLPARRLLESQRCGLPVYRDVGRVLTPAIFLDLPRAAIKVDGVEFRSARRDELDDIIEFVNRSYAQRQLAPVYDRDDFTRGRLQGLAPEDIYLAIRAHKIIGVCAAWDQREFRQTHVEGYSPGLRLLRPFYNAVATCSPLKPLPPKGAAIPCFYLTLIAIENDNRDIFTALLRHVYRARRNGEWHYFIAGLHERDPLASVLQSYRRIDAAGRLYLVHYPEDEAAYKQLDERVPLVEIAGI
jgi:hypothetical protein